MAQEDKIAIISDFGSRSGSTSGPSFSSSSSSSRQLFPAVYNTLLPELRRHGYGGQSLILGTSTESNGPFLLKTTQQFFLLPNDQVGVLLEDGEEVPQFASFFVMTPQACEQDVLKSLNQAKESLAARRERPAGCVLFSCAARGPEPNPHFFNKQSFDATSFCSIFPTTCVIGSYCNGEIGPTAMAGGSSATTVFRSGSASVQGFTAVFGIFALQMDRQTPRRLMQKDGMTTTERAIALLASKRSVL
jgi:hypothetical protein